MLESLHAL
jgi:hypothetical protein